MAGDARFKGPGIELRTRYGSTIGRFDVAEVVARVFPAHRRYATNLERDMLLEKKFTVGPYPADRLTYRSKEMVEFETPPGSEGLGTRSALSKNSSPIRGVAILSGPTPDLVQLSVRLPENLKDLAPVIIRQAEREALQAKR